MNNCTTRFECMQMSGTQWHTMAHNGTQNYLAKQNPELLHSGFFALPLR
jgi:hypothetical protein